MLARRRALFASVFVGALVVAGLPAALAADAPRVTAVAMDEELFVAQVTGFAPGDEIAFSAVVPGGKGLAALEANTDGRAVVAFMVPDGYAGDVELIATGGAASAKGTIRMGEKELEITHPTSAVPSVPEPATEEPVAPGPVAPGPVMDEPEVAAPDASAAGALSGEIKVLAIGASNTYAGGRGGWRKALQQEIDGTSGVTWDFVGSQKDGNASTWDGDSEGVSGVQNGFHAPKVAGYITQFSPDMLVVHCGFNDLNGGKSTDQAAADMKTLLDNAFVADPDVRVLLSGIAPTWKTGPDAKWQDYNARLSGLAKQYAADGFSISYVDPGSTIVRGDIGSDAIHLTDEGHTKLGKLYAPALLDLAGLS